MTFNEAFRAFIVAYEADRALQERCNHESGIDLASCVYFQHLREVASSALYETAKYADLGHR